MNSARWRKAKTTIATDTSFPSKVPTVTRPVNDGVHEVGPWGGSPARIRVVGYGTGDDDDVFEMRILGWSPVGVGNAVELWVPVPIAAFIMTLSTAVGVAGAELANTVRFVDTITAATIAVEATIAADVTRMGTIAISSPANNVVGYVEICVGGWQLIEFTFDATTGDPSGMNALWMPLY